MGTVQRHEHRIGDQAGVDDGVDRRRPQDPAQRSGFDVGTHELGPLKLVARILDVDADQGLHTGLSLERLGEPPAQV